MGFRSRGGLREKWIRGETRSKQGEKRRRKSEEESWTTEGSVCWGPLSGGDSDGQAAPGDQLTLSLSLSWSGLYLWVFLSESKVIFGGEQKERQRKKIGSQGSRLPGSNPLGEKVQEDRFLEE